MFLKIAVMNFSRVPSFAPIAEHREVRGMPFVQIVPPHLSRVP